MRGWAFRLLFLLLLLVAGGLAGSSIRADALWTPPGLAPVTVEFCQRADGWPDPVPGCDLLAAHTDGPPDGRNREIGWYVFGEWWYRKVLADAVFQDGNLVSMSRFAHNDSRVAQVSLSSSGLAIDNPTLLRIGVTDVHGTHHPDPAVRFSASAGVNGILSLDPALPLKRLVAVRARLRDASGMFGTSLYLDNDFYTGRLDDFRYYMDSLPNNDFGEVHAGFDADGLFFRVGDEVPAPVRTSRSVAIPWGTFLFRFNPTLVRLRPQEEI